MPSGKWDFDCAVIGGGPAGLVSAIYLGRFKRKTALFNSGRPRATWAKKVRNLIGYDRGISGRQLLRKLNQQLDEFGGYERFDAQASLTRIEGGFELHTQSGLLLKSKKVILATGIEDVHPQVDNLLELRELGLLKYCSICDGFEQRDKPVAVLAKDDFGIQKAVFLAHWTRRMRIIIPEAMTLAPQRVRELRALRIPVVRCKVMRMEPSRKVRGQKCLEGCEGLWIHVDRRQPFLCSVAYVELGCVIKDSAYAGLRKLRRTQSGYLITTTEQRTSVPGLFATGDCVNLLGQISVAAGQAAVAATTIHNDLLD